MSHANVDLGILQDTKITYGVYAKDSVGFCVVVLGALSLHHGVVALFYNESLRFALESYIVSVLPAYSTPPPPTNGSVGDAPPIKSRPLMGWIYQLKIFPPQ